MNKVKGLSRWLKKLEECMGGGPVVYFLQGLEPRSLVKIGITTNLRGRMLCLASMNLAKLRLIAAIHGDEKLERTYHRRFASQRAHGEWFYWDERLEEVVNEHRVATECCTSAHGEAPTAKSQAAAVERELVLDALRECDGNKTSAAKLLGISRRTVQRHVAAMKEDGAMTEKSFHPDALTAPVTG